MATPIHSWHVARLLFESRLNGVVQPDALYEERIVLFRSPSIPEAEIMARRYGIREGHEYRNEAGLLVTWQLHSVNDVAPVVGEPVSATWEIASRFLRKGELAIASEEG